jgi:ABC-type transport system involved in multi-copper enzyme maturation permease subunit
MVLGPLIGRELGLRARRAGSYWGRFAVGALAVVICLPSLLSPAFSTTSSVGVGVFNTLVAVAFVLCCVACILTADVIAAEKREGTLGLLLLTKVKRFDVILAKLVTNGAVGVISLVTLMPFLMIPVLAGGVTGGEAFRKAIALLNGLFLALALGIYSSASVQDRFKAARRAAIWLIGITFLPLLVQALWPFNSLGSWAPGIFSSLRTVIEGGDYYYRLSPLPYWIGFAVTHALGWAFLIRAGARMQRLVWQEDDPRSTRPRPGKCSHEPGFSRRSNWRSNAYSPVEWLVRRQRGLKTILWLGVLVGILYFLVFRIFWSWRAFGVGSIFWIVAYWVPNVLVGGLSGAFFAWASSRFFVEARRNGELELLLTTPIGAQAIVQDQWKVLHKALVLPLLVSILAFFVPFIFALGSRGGIGGTPLPYLVSSIFSAFNIVLGILALCRVGVWFGLKAHGQAAAILWTVVTVKAVPYLLSFGWTLFSSLLGFPSRAFSSYMYYLNFLPAVVTLAFYIWISRMAKRRLPAELSGAHLEAFPSRESFSRAGQNVPKIMARLRNWNTT